MPDWPSSPWFATLVLTLAAFRLVRLIGWDDLPPVVSLRDRATGASHQRSLAERGNGHDLVVYRRPLLAHFLRCPYCQGFWVGLAVLAFYWACPRDWALLVLAPFALGAAVGLIARVLDP